MGLHETAGSPKYLLYLDIGPGFSFFKRISEGRQSKMTSMGHATYKEVRMPGKANVQPNGNRGEFVENYNRWFDVISAHNDKLKDKVYQLRYQVYCRENNFENPNEHREGREKDGFDDRSTHSLLVDKTTRTPIGTVRLILPDTKAPLKSFPIQGLCNHSLLSNMKLLLNSQVAEISRFSISKEFRKSAETIDSNKPDQAHLNANDSLDKRLVTPFITLGLMKAIMQMSVESGITDLIAVMEPSLLRLLARFGIFFRPIGPLVDFHGMRQPCHANIEELLERARRESMDAWDVITDEGRLLAEMRQRGYRRTVRPTSPWSAFTSRFAASSV